MGDTAIRRRNLINDDPLKLIRICTLLDVFRIYPKTFRICSLYAIAYLCVLHVVGAYNELYTKVQILDSLAIYSVALNLFQIMLLKRFCALNDCLLLLLRQTNPEGSAVYQDVLLKYNWIKILTPLMLIAAEMIYFIVSFTDVALNLLVPLQIIKQSGKFWWIITALNSYCNLFILTTQMIVYSIHIYTSFYIGAQFVILQKFIKKKLHHRSDSYNSQQQDGIYKLLRSFVEFHHKIKRISEDYSKLIGICMISQIANGVINFSACVYLLLMGRRSMYPIITVVLVGEALCIIIGGKMGQIINDESSTLFDLMYACPWYDWDIRNRKTLLIILPNVARPTTVTFLNLISTDNILIMKFFRMCYAVVNFISQMM